MLARIHAISTDIARCGGTKRAIVAAGRSILVITWHLLSALYHDLGPGFYADRIDLERRKRSHIRQLEALGVHVTVKPAASTGQPREGPAPLTHRRVLLRLLTHQFPD
jgi:hypothetical protein